jgi:hypothetical protein
MTTSTLSEVLKQMVEALDYVGYAYVTCEEQAQADAAKQAGLDAIVKLESQEPFGYINHGTALHTKGNIDFHIEPSTKIETRWWTDDIPVYLHPPQRTWVGLTDEEIDAAWGTVAWYSSKGLQELRREYAQAIEAKLKENNS